MSPPHPEVLWAQRSDKVYLTVALPDAKDVSVSFEFLWEPNAVSGKWERHGRVIFKASRDQHESYNFTLYLYGLIEPDWERHGRVIFKASRDQHESYNFTLYLYGLINPDGCKTKTNSRNIRCSIKKMEKGWWKRLLESEEKPPYIKVDEDKWCDEDEGEESDSEFISDDDEQIAGDDEAKGK